MTPIVKEPNPLLHQKAKPVGRITEEILRLIETMIETMHAARGVGLAANQIGSARAILVANPDGGRGKELVLINPSIVKLEGQETSPEGCLSLPGISSDVTRAARITVSGLDRTGKRITLKADKLLAKILQHEVDHLNGRLFVDRVGRWKRQGLLKEYASVSQTLRRVKI